MLTDNDHDQAAAANALERARDAERALADFYPRVLELEGLLADARVHDEAAQAKIAELEKLLEEARAAADHLIEETQAAHRETERERERRLFAEYHVDLIEHTRAFRYLSVPRRLYALFSGKKEQVHPYRPS